MKATILSAAVCFLAFGFLAIAGCGDTKTDSEKSKTGHVHGNDEKLMWGKGEERNHEGFKLNLAWHGEDIHFGEKIEPAAMIAGKDGKPVTDAKVFVSLLAEDKTEELAKEVPTVHEEAGNGEPAHYAQGLLLIPDGTTKAYIRFRIKLPGVAEAFTSNVEIKPHADDH